MHLKHPEPTSEANHKSDVYTWTRARFRHIKQSAGNLGGPSFIRPDRLFLSCTNPPPEHYLLYRFPPFFNRTPERLTIPFKPCPKHRSGLAALRNTTQATRTDLNTP